MAARTDTLSHRTINWPETVGGERNVARHYTAVLSRDPFGVSLGACAWGRIGTKGQGRAVLFASEDEALRFARPLLRRRASATKRSGASNP